jgi:hypothetical protein
MLWNELISKNATPDYKIVISGSDCSKYKDDGLLGYCAV